MDYEIKVLIGVLVFGFLMAWLFTYLGSKSSKQINRIYRKEINRQRQNYENSLNHHKI